MENLNIRPAGRSEFENIRVFYHALIDAIGAELAVIHALGFRRVGRLKMFYADTGWTNYELYELIL